MELTSHLQLVPGSRKHGSTDLFGVVLISLNAGTTITSSALVGCASRCSEEFFLKVTARGTGNEFRTF
jgi:hypothetical protein